ncbi:MAG: hypothetical protein GY898_21010 [Proteobacteria bacterium]|nr:hypothetical protein [Pseudomonadota bacterium]
MSACIFPPWDDRSFDDDDDMTSPPPEGCSEVDLYEPDACEDPAYCGAASVEVGTGSDGWEPLTDGQEVPIWYGSQGGYHIDITARMDNLCPIVFLVPSMYLDPGDGGELVEIFTQTRHVQAVRQEPQVSPLQDFWGIRGFVPCEYWPVDEQNPDITCGEDEQGSAGRIDQFEVVIKMEAWDHNLSPAGEDRFRFDDDEQRVQPVCCNY